MSGATCFSSLGVYKPYLRIEVAEEDRLKTAILTFFDCSAFRNMPMGLTSAENTLQQLMNKVFRGLDFVYAQTNNILIFSKSREEHLAHLAQIFARLN